MAAGGIIANDVGSQIGPSRFVATRSPTRAALFNQVAVEPEPARYPLWARALIIIGLGFGSWALFIGLAAIVFGAR